MKSMIIKESKQIQEATQPSQLNNRFHEEDLIAQLKQIEEDINQYNSVHQIQNAKDVQTTQIKEKTINYQMIKGGAIPQKLMCLTIAINADSSIFVAGCSDLIKIYSLIPGQIKEIQVIGCEEAIDFIQFIKNQFITAHRGGQMRVWIFNEKKFCHYQTLSNQHVGNVNAMVVSCDKNMIISCSTDQTIKAWIKLGDEWEFSQQYKGHTGIIFSISLNQSENLLSSCGFDDRIIILQICKDKQLKRFQSLQIQNPGFRICFVQNEYLVFSPREGNNLVIFKQDHKNQLFYIWENVTIQSENECFLYFPIVYNAGKRVLILKKGHSVFIIRKNREDYFQQDQEIKYQGSFIFGSLSPNGKYLVTWDFYSSQFIVREYTEL